MKKNREVYKVKSGETLWDIAEKKLGDASRWKEIARVSDGRKFTKNTAKNLKIGEKLYLPLENSKASFNKSKINNGKKNSNLTHKELLTFSNLTKLEWQFVNLINESDDVLDADKVEYQKLTDILSNPKLFAEKDEKGNIKEYVYGTDDEGNFLGEEEAKADLRKRAGIALEYLEKKKVGNKAGKFIEDWEVIYGADNYKVVKDYIEYLNSELANSSTEVCPSRSEIDDAKKNQATIKAAFDVTGLTLSVVIWNGSMKTAEKIATKEILKKSTKSLTKKTLTKTINKLIKKADCIPLSLLSAAYFNRGSAAEMLNTISGETEKELIKKLKEKGKIEDLVKELGQRSTVEITQKLDMFDTGFRVVALKKEDTIVVSYKGKRSKDKKLLPKEFDYLQIVYDKLRRDYANSKTKIVFTGYEGGADLSFLNSLFIGQNKNIQSTLFYNNLRELKGYVDFTPHDLNKDYKSNLLININSEVDDISNQIMKTAFGAAVATGLAEGGVLTGSVAAGVTLSNLALVCAVIVIWELMSGLKDYFTSQQIKKEYQILKDLGFIKAEKEFSNQGLSTSDFSGNSEDIKQKIENSQSKIKGYIADEFLYQPYLELLVDDSRLLANLNENKNKKAVTIKVKKEHAFYLLFKQQETADFLQDDIKINKKKYKAKLMGNQFDIEYLVLKEYVNRKETVHTTMGPRRENVETTKLYWALEKNNNGIYEIVSLFDGDETPEEGLFEPLMPLTTTERKELGKYNMLINLMEITGVMQRNYIKKIDSTFEYVYPTQSGINIAKTLLLKDKLLKETRDIKNEFAFMPYLKTDGNIDRLEPELHDDYLASVFKSMLHKEKEYNNKLLFEIRKVKYGLEKGVIDYKHDFDTANKSFLEIDIDQNFLELIKDINLEVEVANNSYTNSQSSSYSANMSTDKKTVDYNYQLALKKIKKDPSILEEYYQIEEIDDHPKFTEATHVIKVHSDYKDRIEYKYNLFDYITGGELKLYVRDINQEEVINEDQPIAASPQEKPKEEKQESKKIEKEATPNSDFKRKKKLITNLTKTSSISEIHKAAEVVVSELKRKRQPLIATTLEDYLAGKRIQKRVDPKELRTLKSVKAAETELKLKVNRRLVTKLSYILRNQHQIKRDERIKFRIRARDLVHPYNKSIEEFINASKDSRLKVEGKFELNKIPNRKKLKLKGELCYNWENDYRWRVGKRKLLPGYGFIEDYQFKKLANQQARPYKMYAQWSYYLSTKLNLLHSEVDTLRTWCWREFCSFEHV